MALINILVRATDQASATLARTGVAGETMGTRLEAAGRRASTLGTTLTRRVSLPLAALGALSVKAFASLDSALNESLAIMGDVSDRMRAKMETTARAVAKSTTFSATEAAEAFYFLASTGLDAAQSVEALPAVARFAQAGMFDLARATEFLTDSQSALGLKSADAAENMLNMVRVSDVLTEAANLSNASVEQFAESLTNKAAGAIRNLNKPMEEGVAVLAAFADQGLKGASAGNALAIVFRDLQTSARKNADEWRELGVSVFDSSGDMRNVADIVADLEGLLEGMTDKQKAATLAQLGFQDRSKSFLLTLLGTSDAIRTYEDDLNSAGGTTERVANKQLQSFTNRLKLLWSRITDVAITIGAQLAPAIEMLARRVAAAVEWFGRLPAPIRDTTLAVAGLLAVTGPLLKVWGVLLVRGAAIKSMFETLYLTALSAKAAIAASGLAFSAAAIGAAAFAGALVGLTAGLVIVDPLRIMGDSMRTNAEAMAEGTLQLGKFQSAQLGLGATTEAASTATVDWKANIEGLQTAAREADARIGGLAAAELEEAAATDLANQAARKRVREIVSKLLPAFDMMAAGLTGVKKGWDLTANAAERATRIIADKQATIAADLRKLDDIKIGDKLKARLLELGPDMVHAFVSGNQGQQTAIRNNLKAYDKAYEETRGATKTIVRRTVDGNKRVLADGAASAGAAFDNGLATAIREGGSGAIGAAIALANEIVARTKQRLQIGSPSRVSKAMGEDWVEGLIQGMQFRLGRLTDVVSRITDVIKDALSEGLDRSHLEAARGISGAIREHERLFERLLETARDRLSKLQGIVGEFRDKVMSGFSDAGDLVSGLLDRMRELTAEGGPGFGGTDIQAFLAEQLAANQQLATGLQALSEMGLDPALLGELASQGPGALPLIEALLAGGEDMVTSFNDVRAAIDEFAQTTQEALIDKGFGKALAAAAERIDRLRERIDRFIEKIGDQIQRLREALQAENLGAAISSAITAIFAALERAEKAAAAAAKSATAASNAAGGTAGGGKGARAIPRLASGGHIVQSGLAFVHAGETVTPAGHTATPAPSVVHHHNWNVTGTPDVDEGTLLRAWRRWELLSAGRG